MARSGRIGAVDKNFRCDVFKIEASISVIDQHSRSLQIRGIEKLQIQSYVEQTTIINGDTTRAYVYTVKANEPGNYEIGPAVLDRNGARIVSEKKSIEIVERNETEQGSSAQTVFLTWSVEQERVVVGQKVMAYLRFYYQDD